ncbi:HK97-gp10 family putative phage morphogenesis protein [Oxalicibacterium faecigallinarum]|nr:HK97-gp10 family putative phage morphogenesis protein [Oxalicibacterium faecigallinarum]
MVKTTIKVRGLRELGEAMKGLENDIKLRICRAAVQEGAKIIRNLAQSKAPVAPQAYDVVDETYNRSSRKGKKRAANVKIVQPRNIAKNIVTKRVPRSKMTAETVVAIRGKFEHGYANRIGILQEFGTVKTPAQPFMRPAFNQGKAPAVAVIKNTLKKRIDSAVKKNAKKPK